VNCGASASSTFVSLLYFSGTFIFRHIYFSGTFVAFHFQKQHWPQSSDAPKHAQALAVIAAFPTLLLRYTRGSNKFEKNRKVAQINLKRTEKWLVPCLMAAVMRRAADVGKVARLREKRG
jgi:hypothetical protein